MLTELDVDGVVLGHSERRQLFGETDRALALKVPARSRPAWRRSSASARPRRSATAGDTERKLRTPGPERASSVSATIALGDVVIAYEPIWAIGTGQVATPEQAQEAIAFIRALVGDRSREQAERTRILYGGSVNADNAAELLALPDVDGALVGGASLDPAPFAAIVDGRPRDERRGRGGGAGLRARHPRRLGAGAVGPRQRRRAGRARRSSTRSGSAIRTRTLTAGGAAVGLPDGQMGNSEVGHLNLGAGAIIRQDLTRIDDAIEDGSIADNEVLQAALRSHARVHLIGLVSDGGVHSSLEHLRALCDDGARATSSSTPSPTAATRRRTAARQFVAEVESWGTARVGSVIGPLLRDGSRPIAGSAPRRRVRLLLDGEAPYHADDRPAGRARRLRARRDRRVHRADARRRRGVRSRPDDSVFCFNFRPDRMRQLVRALDEAGVRRRDDDRVRRGAGTYPVAFPPERPADDAAEGDRGGRRRAAARRRDGEVPARDVLLRRRRRGPVRGRAPRARAVAARRPDLRPQARDERPRGGRRRSSAPGETDRPMFGIINFANADMVGHTGSIPAAIAAVETVDACLGDGRRGRPGDRRRADHHRRPRQRRRDARARRLAGHRALAQPGPADRHRARA